MSIIFVIYLGTHRFNTSSAAINSFCCGAYPINSIVFDVTYCYTTSRNHGWLRFALFADFNHIKHRPSKCHCLRSYHRNILFSSRFSTYRYGRENISILLFDERLAGNLIYLSLIEFYKISISMTITVTITITSRLTLLSPGSTR